MPFDSKNLDLDVPVLASLGFKSLLLKGVSHSIELVLNLGPAALGKTCEAIIDLMSVPLRNLFALLALSGLLLLFLKKPREVNRLRSHKLGLGSD